MAPRWRACRPPIGRRAVRVCACRPVRNPVVSTGGAASLIRHLVVVVMCGEILKEKKNALHGKPWVYNCVSQENKKRQRRVYSLKEEKALVL